LYTFYRYCMRANRAPWTNSLAAQRQPSC